MNYFKALLGFLKITLNKLIHNFAKYGLHILALIIILRKFIPKSTS